MDEGRAMKKWFEVEEFIMKKRFSLTVTLVCIGIFLCGFGQVYAQDKYPSRPIEIVTSFPAGGLSEMWVRTVAKYMDKLLGQPLINLPKPGGGNVIGFTYVANARPDGYTLLNQGDYFMPILNKTATFKLEDLRVIAQVSRNGNVLCVAADAPWKTYKEFVDYSKKNGNIKYLVSGQTYTSERKTSTDRQGSEWWGFQGRGTQKS